MNFIKNKLEFERID
jgi:hypothetical protein